MRQIIYLLDPYAPYTPRKPLGVMAYLDIEHLLADVEATDDEKDEARALTHHWTHANRSPSRMYCSVGKHGIQGYAVKSPTEKGSKSG